MQVIQEALLRLVVVYVAMSTSEPLLLIMFSMCYCYD